MRIYSIKVSQTFKKVALLALALGVVLLAGRTVGSVSVEKSNDVKLGGQKVKTSQQRIDLLNRLGWEVEEVSGETMDVTIPKEWDEVYEKYNIIQSDQGLDLSKLKGKNCTRYTYLIKNHPSNQQNVRINLLLHKGKLVGADLASFGMDGFMDTIIFPFI